MARRFWVDLPPRSLRFFMGPPLRVRAAMWTALRGLGIDCTAQVFLMKTAISGLEPEQGQAKEMADRLLHELEPWSMELQRSLPMRWNPFLSFLQHCMRARGVV